MNDITDSMAVSLGKLWEFVMDREAWRPATASSAELLRRAAQLGQ